MSREDNKAPDKNAVPIGELVDHHQRSAREIGDAAMKLSDFLQRNPDHKEDLAVAYRQGVLEGRTEELGALSALIETSSAEQTLGITPENIVDE